MFTIEKFKAQKTSQLRGNHSFYVAIFPGFYYF